jgi:hypothetical protein
LKRRKLDCNRNIDYTICYCFESFRIQYFFKSEGNHTTACSLRRYVPRPTTSKNFRCAQIPCSQ